MRVELRRKIPRWATPLRQPARYKGASGGRASGKSHFFAEEAVEAMLCDPNLRFACIREVQRSLEYSAKTLVEDKIRQLGVGSQFRIMEREIVRRGGEGVMIFAGMQDHTADSIKSLENFGRAWVEEAQSISQRSLDLLLPTIRTPGSELWFSWNPDHSTDPVEAFFNSKPANAIHVRANYTDNPFCPQEMKDEAARVKATDPEKYAHIWEGGYDFGGAGRVYSAFRDTEYPDGNTDGTVQDHRGELLVGMDFNVNPMSAVVGVRVADELLVLDALEISTSNTEEMAQELRRRYPQRIIAVCPDPAGKQRRTSAAVGQTDFTILQNYGFRVRAPAGPPPVVDRVNNVNAMLHDLNSGRRRVRIHPRAQALRTALSNHTYKAGTSLPDKTDGFDHITDALGYLLWQEFNVLDTRRARAFAHSV